MCTSLQADLMYDGGVKIAIEGQLSSVAVLLQITVCVSMLKGRLAIGMVIWSHACSITVSRFSQCARML